MYVDTRGFDRYKNITLARAIDGSLRTVGARIASDSHGITGGYDIQNVVAQTRATAPFSTRRGRAIDIFNLDRLAIIFERGSYRKGRQRSAEGNRGVRPVRFLRDPLRDRKGELIPELRRRLW